jgi:DNA polymerase-3 subunit delta'
VARELAAELLSEGSLDPDGARGRVRSGAHPDLTWVVPSGAHEILVSDIDEPVVAAASKTPFESSRRVFVIERVDELGDEAANRMLKTLEEPARFVHLILMTDRLSDVSWFASTPLPKRRWPRRSGRSALAPRNRWPAPG